MYQYRCAMCGTTSPAVGTRAARRAERDRHRDQVHAGHIPDGEQYLTVPRAPSRAELRHLLWLALIPALPVLEWIARHAG